MRFTKEAMELLLEYDYPGNIRELENIIERVVTLSQGEVIKKEEIPLPFSTLPSAGYPSLSEITNQAEREYIIRVLKLTGGNRARAAELLGISRKTLWEKINAYGIEI